MMGDATITFKALEAARDALLRSGSVPTHLIMPPGRTNVSYEDKEIRFKVEIKRSRLVGGAFHYSYQEPVKMDNLFDVPSFGLTVTFEKKEYVINFPSRETKNELPDSDLKAILEKIKKLHCFERL